MPNIPKELIEPPDWPAHENDPAAKAWLGEMLASPDSEVYRNALIELALDHAPALHLEGYLESPDLEEVEKQQPQLERWLTESIYPTREGFSWFLQRAALSAYANTKPWNHYATTEVTLSVPLGLMTEIQGSAFAANVSVTTHMLELLKLATVISKQGSGQ